MSNRAALSLSTRSIKIYSGAYDPTARADIAEHLADHANPHATTKSQVGLGNVDNTSDAAKPISSATAAALAAKAPLLSPGLTGIPTAPTAPTGTTTTQVATTAFAYAAANAVVAGQVDVPTSDLALHLADNDNPHHVTKAQVGLALVDNTADLDKPVSGPTQAAINAAVAGVGGDTIADDLAEHLADVENPHAVTAMQVGLGAVDNTADASKPVSFAMQIQLNLKAPLQGAHLTGAPTTPTQAQGTDNDQIASTAFVNAAVAPWSSSSFAHIANLANPHGVTKSQVGLSAVDNTSDANKPVSTATQTALNLKAPLANPVLTGVPVAPTAPPGTNTTQIASTAFTTAAVGATNATLAAHTGNISNPHSVTKAQVGLASVDNTADLAKPISTATQTALNGKAPLASPALTGVPTAPTAAVGNSSVQIATTAFADQIGDTLTASLGAHTSNVANPHAVTKLQVGLGAADNTSDLAKPISTATQFQLNLKAPLAGAHLTGAPTAPTASQGVDNDQIASTAFVNAAVLPWSTSSFNHNANTANPHATTKAQVGLGSVDNTSDAAKPISIATQTVLNTKAPLNSPALTGSPTAPTPGGASNSTLIATTAFVAAHTTNFTNPHNVTKTQVGLSNVDNTSDAAKPVSTATQVQLNTKANLAGPTFTGVPRAPTALQSSNDTQIATTAFVRAALDGTAFAADRPGDAVQLYGTLATGTPAAMPRVDPTWVATSAAGNVLRVNAVTADDPQVIAPVGAFPVGPVYDVRWQVQRQTDPIDPLNDSVTLAIRWLTNTYAGVAGAAGISTVANLPLLIVHGIEEHTARVGLELVPPAGAVYFRPYVQLFGNNHVTDIIVLGVNDGGCVCGIASVRQITASTTLPLGTTGVILVNSPTASITVTLPPSPVAGQTVTIKDVAASASLYPISITAGGGVAIENQLVWILSNNFSWATFCYAGTRWVQI